LIDAVVDRASKRLATELQPTASCLLPGTHAHQHLDTGFSDVAATTAAAAAAAGTVLAGSTPVNTNSNTTATAAAAADEPASMPAQWHNGRQRAISSSTGDSVATRLCGTAPDARQAQSAQVVGAPAPAAAVGILAVLLQEDGQQALGADLQGWLTSLQDMTAAGTDSAGLLTELQQQLGAKLLLSGLQTSDSRVVSVAALLPSLLSLSISPGQRHERSLQFETWGSLSDSETAVCSWSCTAHQQVHAVVEVVCAQKEVPGRITAGIIDELAAAATLGYVLGRSGPEFLEALGDSCPAQVKDVAATAMQQLEATSPLLGPALPCKLRKSLWQAASTC